MSAMFKKIGNNRFSGVGLGTGVTAVIQSSTAVTVMTVGLVNVGILSLFQATAIIMGANIGTTLTNFLVALSFLKVKYIFMSFAFFGIVVRMIGKKDRTKLIADILVSVGILFVGLDLMSSVFRNFAPITNFFKNLFTRLSYPNVAIAPLALILLGALFTIIIQSSTASMGIYMSMVASDVLDFGTAVFLILGTEFGTCFTAVLSSIPGNRSAKRAAMTHLLYNIFGTVLFTAIIWPLHGPIVGAYTRLVPNPIWQMSLFPFINNIVSVAILIWFIRPFNRLVCWMIKDKPDKEGMIIARFTDAQLLKTPSIAISQTVKGLNVLGQKTKDNFDAAFNAIMNDDLESREKIEKEETVVNGMAQAFSDYLVKISSASISATDQKLSAGLHHVLSDIERIGDQAITMLSNAARKMETGATFSPVAVEEVTTLYAKVMKLFNILIECDFTNSYFKVHQKNQTLKQEIDEYRDEIIDAHIKRLRSGACISGASEFYYAIITSLKSVTEHLINIDKVLMRLSRKQPKSNSSDNNISAKVAKQLSFSDVASTTS
jgi:phosphate:Na+ symporter